MRYRQREATGLPYSKSGRIKTAFTAQEETKVFDLLRFYANRGISLNRQRVIEAFKLMIRYFLWARYEALTFRDGSPGVPFVRKN